MPYKVRDVIEMKIPRIVKEVQHLTCCKATLGRFLSISTNKSLHFFKTLKHTTFPPGQRGGRHLALAKRASSQPPKARHLLPGGDAIHISGRLGECPQQFPYCWTRKISTPSLFFEPRLGRCRSKISPYWENDVCAGHGDTKAQALFPGSSNQNSYKSTSPKGYWRKESI